MDQDARRVSLKWKIGGTFAAVMLILGMVVVAAVYQLTKNALQDQFDQRILIITNNLSDAAAGHMVGKNLLALNALVSKYTLLDGVAYAFIEDAKGEIVAPPSGSFPPELREGLPAAAQRQVYRRKSFPKFRWKAPGGGRH